MGWLNSGAVIASNSAPQNVTINTLSSAGRKDKRSSRRWLLLLLLAGLVGQTHIIITSRRDDEDEEEEMRRGPTIKRTYSEPDLPYY